MFCPQELEIIVDAVHMQVIKPVKSEYPCVEEDAVLEVSNKGINGQE